MGEQSVCIFCGHHTGRSVRFRKKSPRRALEELHHLIKTYQPRRIFAKDSALPPDYPEKFFSHFTKPKQLEDFFYEVSPQLSFEQLVLLSRKGVKTLQPGIESLSDRLLSILQKKTTAVNNIRFLRDCRTLGIRPLWNFLYTIPGEREIDYTRMAGFIPLLTHLCPSYTIRSLIIIRYSPLFEGADDFNLRDLQPVESFKYIFPEYADVKKLSLFFTARYDVFFEYNNNRGEIKTALRDWKAAWQRGVEKPHLELVSGNNGFNITNTRPMAVQPLTELNAAQVRLLSFLDKPQTQQSLEVFVKKTGSRRQFETLIKNDWVLKQGNQYLSLVVNKKRKEGYATDPCPYD